MAASLYTGTGAAQNIVNSGNNPAGVTFQPDFVWIKSRSTTTGNIVFNSIQGVNKYYVTNSPAGVATGTNTLTAFNANGFSVDSDSGSLGVNLSAVSYVAWQWAAGAGVTASNTNGTITSTVCVNQSAGISIVSYTGNGTNPATYGHGLNAAPKIVLTFGGSGNGAEIFSNSAYNGSWTYLATGTTAASTNATPPAPTSTLVNLAASSLNNSNASAYLALCLAEVAGFSKFSNYTGNASTNGPFVYCGFRPRFLLIKRGDSTGNWYMWDTSRSQYNVMGEELYPNLTTIGTVATDLDILSNGFKLRSTAADLNASAGVYVFMAFAENPFNISRAR